MRLRRVPAPPVLTGLSVLSLRPTPRAPRAMRACRIREGCPSSGGTRAAAAAACRSCRQERPRSPVARPARRGTGAWPSRRHRRRAVRRAWPGTRRPRGRTCARTRRRGADARTPVCWSSSRSADPARARGSRTRATRVPRSLASSTSSSLGEVGSAPGLDRPLAQQRRAEGVDGPGEETLEVRERDAPSARARSADGGHSVSVIRVLERALEPPAQLGGRLPRERDGRHPVDGVRARRRRQPPCAARGTRSCPSPRRPPPGSCVRTRVRCARARVIGRSPRHHFSSRSLRNAASRRRPSLPRCALVGALAARAAQRAPPARSGRRGARERPGGDDVQREADDAARLAGVWQR